MDTRDLEMEIHLLKLKLQGEERMRRYWVRVCRISFFVHGAVTLPIVVAIIKAIFTK